MRIIEKYFKDRRLDETRACNIMNVHFLSDDGQIMFYEDCLKIAEKIKEDTENKSEQAFIRCCPFYTYPNLCENIERSTTNCKKNESECENLKYYRNEYRKLDQD